MNNVLITGGTGGIGSALATYYSNMGYTVLLHYNTNIAKAQQLQSQINNNGGNVHLFQADLTDIGQIDNMVRRIIALHKHIDILVNNAGVALHSQIQDTTLECYNNVMDINCRGAYFVTRAVIDNMIARNSGAIVNVSSIWGLHGASCESVYSMSKHALIGFTNSLAMELDDTDITVNCICPPIVLTSMTSHMSDDDIADFNNTYNVGVVSAECVAQHIFDLSVGQDSNKIIEIK